MKTKRIVRKLAAALWLLTCSALLMIPASSNGQYVLGSWQNNTGDGWIDWHTQDSITNVAVANIYSFVPGVVPSYAQSLQINQGGYYQGLALKLESIPGAVAAFTNNNLLNFTFSVPAATNTSGYSQLFQLYINSPGTGFYGVPFSTNTWSETGSTGNDGANGQPNFYYGPAGSVRSQTVSFNYSSLLPLITTNTGYIELIFAFNPGGGAPTNFYINNMTLSGAVNQTIYTVDDFSTNGVGPTNPTNDDYNVNTDIYDNGDITNAWVEWFGNGITNIYFDPTVNVDGSTSNGAMAIQIVWDSASGNGQQFALWQGNAGCYTFVPGGTVGIGYPQYTNLECDVRFDAVSLTTTNTNGVLGVIRLGVRGFGKYGQDWINSSYTTISDTNWHHINAILDTSNPDFGNIGAAIIGEDVNASVGGGGLNGYQLLYVDNIRFTGPLLAPPPPPVTLGTVQNAKPGLRIFAGSAVNTYDRELLYTIDQNQSWADPGATYPVKYSFSLQDYNTNILQTMVEFMGDGATPTTYGEYADYSGSNTLWLQLNPVTNAVGQVIASVQWKTNTPNANPNHTETIFTNSTAVGTWALVFTSANTGYVVAPGQVILGSTNFTINDPNVTSDFADPVFAAFGLQANSTAGEGAYEDWGMISVSGVVDGNEFEDFTKEGGDISIDVTPSGFFDSSMSALPASLIIQTTNDALWVNWTAPATGHSLATSTNLVNPAAWINPGWYSGYTDTNAPRVMPLATPFANKFWVLLPNDDLPTASGSQNATPPASGPLAPNVYFRTATNVVSP